ncbi:MAG TPA: hypothetical protein PKX13_12065 [Acidiphilium sp.]|nr:hypothetical protein [Acidiphilium sp.]
MAKSAKPKPKINRGRKKAQAAADQSVPVRGRPRSHTTEVEVEICRRLALGETLREICRTDGMPDPSTVREWVLTRPSFSPQYMKAREMGFMTWSDELIEIADDGRNDWMENNDPNNPGWKANGEHSRRSQIRIDARKWLLAKALPKVFGDRLQTDVQTLDRNGNPTDPANVNVLVLAADKLTSDELRVLVALYRKMGVKLPHEPEPPTLEHDDGDEE